MRANLGVAEPFVPWRSYHSSCGAYLVRRRGMEKIAARFWRGDDDNAPLGGVPGCGATSDVGEVGGDDGAAPPEPDRGEPEAEDDDDDWNNPLGRGGRVTLPPGRPLQADVVIYEAPVRTYTYTRPLFAHEVRVVFFPLSVCASFIVQCGALYFIGARQARSLSRACSPLRWSPPAVRLVARSYARARWRLVVRPYPDAAAAVARLAAARARAVAALVARSFPHAAAAGGGSTRASSTSRRSIRRTSRGALQCSAPG